MSTDSKSLGLYIHIPFCSFMCHYCDFAKTANWDQGLLHEYVNTLSLHLQMWLEEFVEKQAYRIDTLFLGGGTPGLLTSEFEQIFQILSRFKIELKEASIEINPENANLRNLKLWRSLGFNRISMGVQSFQERGLKALTRQHSPSQLQKALEESLQVFDNVNCDLIYAWHGQTLEEWKSDLRTLQDYPIHHISLYCLTMEERTPFGRAQSRGVFGPENDIFQEECYEYARSYLQNEGWEHYECSNWSRVGKNCQHNAKYWQNLPFLGVGAGAWGYLPDKEIGIRYGYTRKERLFSKAPIPTFANYKKLPLCEFESRQSSDWLTEYVGCGLRYKDGIDLQMIASKTGYSFHPQGLCVQALEDGRLRLEGFRLRLSQANGFEKLAGALKF